MDDKYNSDSGLGFTEVAFLLQYVINMSQDIKRFYVQALNPMNMKSPIKTTTKVQNPNIINKEKFSTGKVQTGSNILVEMPKEVARNFPTNSYLLGLDLL